MSYHTEKLKGKRNQQGRSTASLAHVMGGQGDQPKHKDQGHDYVGQVLGSQGGRKSGSKGSCHKPLGGAMQQGGGR